MAPEERKRHWWHKNEEDVQRWAGLFKSGKPIVHIAQQGNVAPSTVSYQLHELGIDIRMGQHHVTQLPLKYSMEFVELIGQGREKVLEFVDSRVWGILATEKGKRQVRSFCDFVKLHKEGVGVKEIARRLSLHRSTIAEWRQGTDQPYLIRAARDTFELVPRMGWKLLPIHLTSGGNEPTDWVQVPQRIDSYDDILTIIRQLRPLDRTYERSSHFGLSKHQVDRMLPELLAYVLGIMVGDSSKLGGEQSRYASMNLDLQFTKKQATNERLGEFVLLCVNSLGIAMERKKDKPPTGVQRMSKNPTPAYRWISERSPLLAWMFFVGLGLQWSQTTTTDRLEMGWIVDTPTQFKTRFVQGCADSDGCTRKYVTDIASVPNAEFFKNLLHSLGVMSARIAYENGEPLRTSMKTQDAAKLPIFNEIVKGYRYQRLMEYSLTGTN